MSQHCPHCRTEIDDLATTCPACGAQKGILRPGWSVARWRQAANVMFGFAAVPFVLGLFFAHFVANYGSNTWRDGAMGFLLLTPFMAFFGSVGLVMRFIVPRMREGWFR